MKTKLRLTIIAIVLALLSTSTATVQAEDYTYITNSGTITITGYTGPRGYVVIPITINGLPVASIGNGAFSHCTSLTSITIPDSVTSIGDYAFHCTSLTSVTIENPSVVLGRRVFLECSSLPYARIGNGAMLLRRGSCDGSVTIQPTIDGLPVTHLGDELFSGCYSLTSITLPESVTSIGGYAFSYTSLTSITLPESVTSIGEEAFSGCERLAGVTIPNGVTTIKDMTFDSCRSLTSITIPNSVTSIGQSAFAYCTSLTSLTIPNSVTTIATGTFNRCSSLTNIIIPNSVTNIGGWAFSWCGLTGVKIPDSVTSIGESAFEGCTSLTGVTIPDSVTSIEQSAFAYCTRFTSVTLPNRVNSIGDRAFEGCTTLTLITVDLLNPSYSSLDGVLFNKNQTVLIEYPGGKAGSYTIPDSVTSIGDDAFYYRTNLTAITIPNSVTSIGDRSFWCCSSLTNIVIPENVMNIGDGAFHGCVTLSSLTIPNSVTSIGESAFSGCRSLTGVTIPNSVTSIGNLVFYWCTSMSSVTIGNSVTNIGYQAFAFCSNLTSITIPNSIIAVGDNAFVCCTSLTNVTIGNGVTSIGEGAFSGCTSLTNIAVDPTNPFYSSVDGVLFDKDLTRLIQYPEGKVESYTIPNGVINIEGGAFAWCASLTSLTIPESLTDLGSWGTFRGDSSLTEITVDPLNPAYSGLDGILFNKDLTTLIQYPGGKAGSYTISEGVINIADAAFAWCDGLTSVTIPNSVTHIGNFAFYLCSSLTNVTIGNGLTSIGGEAFMWNSLSEIYFGGNAPRLPDWYVFNSTTNLTVYYLPGTSGWDVTFAGLPTAPWLLPYPVILTSPPNFGITSNGFGFTISWATNASVVVEVTTTIANPVWSPVSTNALSNGTAYFRDAEWTNCASRFYRVRSQ